MNELVDINQSSKSRSWIAIAAIVTSVLVLAAVTSSSRQLGGFSLTSAHPANERVIIAVEGMHCDGCAAGIKAMLKRTAGVISADVSYERKEAVVDYDSQKTTPEKIVEAINNLGYKARVKNNS